MKLLKTIAATILLLTVGSCAICFVAYKVFLDKPGFFRQFDNVHEVREHLLSDLVLHEESKTDTIDYMQQHLSHDEGCTPLRDATISSLYCIGFANDCPPVTDETPNSVMHCLVPATFL